MGAVLGRRDIYIVIYALGSGGRTAAVIDQCEVFAEMGLNPVIVTFDYARDLAVNIERASLPSNVRVLNMFEDLAWRDAGEHRAGGAEEFDDAGLSVAEVPEKAGRRLTYFDEVGRCVRLRRVADGRIDRDILLTNGAPSLVRDYDARGFCSREFSVMGSERAIVAERYYAADGFCYLTRHLDPSTGRQRGNYVHHRGTRKSSYYEHNTPLHAAWLANALRAHSGDGQKPFVIGESASGVLKVLDLPEDIAVTLYMFHENHLRAPYRLGAPVRPDYGDAPERLREMPQLIVPTETQAEDIRAQFGAGVKVRAIPNRVSDKRSGAPVEKVRGRIGSFGRLAESKQLDKLLHIFRDVHKRAPHARFDIFGDGPERGKLEKLARTLRIDDVVTFHGRVSNVGDEMARCEVTATTTATESFGLSIAESLAAGTPVVSYAVNYGPTDLIQDGHDGYLIEPGQDEDFADRLVELMQHPRRARRMGERAEKRFAEEFSREKFSEAWRDALLAAEAEVETKAAAGAASGDGAGSR